jgi:predicted metal-dependent phosphoesterase TrpH
VAVERHPHLADPRPDGWVRVDLHSHTMWSGDSTTTPDELVQAVLESGIDVLCITDHNAVAGALELADRLPCRVVVGEELRTHAGEIIGLFLAERVPIGLGPAETCRRIRDQGGVVYVPHPFDPMRANLRADTLDEIVAAGLVDALEVRNAKTSLEHLNRRAADYAGAHGLLAGAGSDAHVPRALGAAYVEMPDFDDPASFLLALEQGRVVGHHFDEPRPWAPRIVPSTGG